MDDVFFLLESTVNPNPLFCDDNSLRCIVTIVHTFWLSLHPTFFIVFFLLCFVVFFGRERKKLSVSFRIVSALFNHIIFNSRDNVA